MDKIFDSIFRTLSEKNPKLLIPLINEFFNKDYPLDCEVQLLHGEHHIAPDDYSEEVTDSCIRIGNKLYHIECQSSPDGSMAVRMIEYDFYIALENAERTKHRYTMSFPDSAVLYLRYSENTPDSLKIDISFPDGQHVTYEVPVIKLGKYGRDELLDKKMYFLIPYYLMKYEKIKDAERIKEMTDEYKILYNGMQEAYNKSEISAYDKCNIVTFTNRLLEYLYPEDVAAEGVKNMGGTILRTDADEFLERGMEQGLEKGLVASIESLMTKMKMTVDQAMDALSIPEDEQPKFRMLIKQQ